MKRILHVINTGGPGGAETVFLELIDRLDPSEFESWAVIPDEGWLLKELVDRGHRPLVVPTGGSFDVGYIRALSRIVRSHRIDLLQAHLFGPSIYGSIVGLLNRIPVVSTFHGDVDISDGEAYAWLKFQAIRRGSTRLVFVSQDLASSMLKQHPLPWRRSHVIENGIDLGHFTPRTDDRLRRELGIPSDAFLIGAVGNVRPAKRYDLLLRAAARLTGEPGVHFVVLGHWHGELDPQLVALCRDLRLEQRIHFAGFRDDIAAMFSNFDAYLLTSDSEGFSLSTLQALASGVPVVATRCGGPETMLRDDVTGLLVDRGNVEQIADALLRLRRDIELRRRLAHAGRAFVEKRFDVTGQVARYAALYDQIFAAA